MPAKAKHALERLFHKDDATVTVNDGPMGDYKITIDDACITGWQKEAIRNLGFKEESTHGHSAEDSEAVVLVLYVSDTR